MRSRLLRALLPAALLAMLAFAVPAAANHSEPDSSPNVRHVANVDKEGSNSDLAFWENIAAAGHFQGFRLIDITKPERPKLLVDFPCNGGQGDVSFYKAKERLLLIQSVDSPQTSPNCNSSNSQFQDALPGPLDWEGVRVIDVTNPRAPFRVASIETDCGSHTHTTIPDPTNQRAIVYVSSYPLSGLGDECKPPHSKIAIVEIPDANPAASRLLKYQPLHDDTQFFGEFRGCHDIQAFLDSQVKVAAAACLSEGQLWDISDPANPTTLTAHTHIDNALVEVWHSAALTWDHEVVLFWDEHGGGVAHGCNGSADTTGNIWFYEFAPPGTPALGLFGRYQLPRPEPVNQVCDLHIGSIIPVNVNDEDAYVGVSSAYEGGLSVFDFTPLQTVDSPNPNLDPALAPIVANEIAWWDNEGADGVGADDVWAAYWYNDYIFANGGIGNRQTPPRGNRGFDVYRLLLDDLEHKFTARKLNHFNPQTQEVFGTLGG
jgi:hypothetical protein